MLPSVVPLGRTRRDLDRFWRAGLPPYEGDPHFVVPLRMDCFDRWGPGNPAFEEIETQHFVAVRDGRDVGRIAAVIDRVADRVHEESVGNFGWFECERDQASAQALLDAAASWLRERGHPRMRGPLSYNTNGISGLLVRDDAPGPAQLDMAYNPPWYADLLESYGLAKAKDLIAFWVPSTEQPPERFMRVAGRLRERGKVCVRSMRLDKKGFAEDIEHILTIYNGAWAKNWGFVPMSEAEIRHQAKSFRPLLDARFALIAEVEGEAAAFVLGIPDLNQALASIRGRLWPWSIVKLLLARRHIDHVRVLTLGVLPHRRRLGLDVVLIHDIFHAAWQAGLTGGECGWILEDNQLMIAGIEQSGGRPYRCYRVYETGLD